MGDNNEVPGKWTLWQHKKGMNYMVLQVTNLKTTRPEDYPVTVVYQNCATGDVWSRPLSKWHESFIHD